MLDLTFLNLKLAICFHMHYVVNAYDSSYLSAANKCTQLLLMGNIVLGRLSIGEDP